MRMLYARRCAVVQYSLDEEGPGEPMYSYVTRLSMESSIRSTKSGKRMKDPTSLWLNAPQPGIVLCLRRLYSG